jgi:hypothetical protein
MSQRHSIPFVALLLISACGGRSGSDPGESGARPGVDAGTQTPPAIVILPATAQLKAGAAPVEFTATLSGATGAIVWSLDGPGHLSTTTGAAVTYTPPTALPGDTAATITASGGGVTQSALIGLSRAATIVVSGRLLDSSRAPAPGITVSIGDRGTVTDEDGRFSLADVPTPYALTALSVESKEAVVYQGLTRPDPTILWPRSLASPDMRGQVAGRVDGGVADSSTIQTALVFFSPEAQIQSTSLDGHYVLPVSWSGPLFTTGAVHALQIASPVRGALPTSYPGYGVTTGVQVFAEGTTAGVDVFLDPPKVSSVRGTYALPQGYTFLAKFFLLSFSDGASMSIGFDDSPGLDFNYLAPSDIDARVVIVAEASGPGASVLRRESAIAPGANGVLVVLPQGAQIIAPADGTQMVDAQTEFSWGGFPGGVFTIDFIAPGHGPTFRIVTGDTRTTLPQLAALPLPSRVTYAWTVTASAPFASVDAAADPHALIPQGNTVLQSFSDGLGFTTR